MSHANTLRAIADALFIEEKILRQAAAKADEYHRLALAVQLAGPRVITRTRHGRVIYPDAACCTETAEYFERQGALHAQRVRDLQQLLKEVNPFTSNKR